MLNDLQTPAQQARNLRDRVARVPSRRSRTTEVEAAESRPSKEPPPQEEKGERAAEAIMEAGRQEQDEVEVGPEAERAARFILEAEEPEEDVDEAVELLKEAGKPKDTWVDRDESE